MPETSTAPRYLALKAVALSVAVFAGAAVWVNATDAGGYSAPCSDQTEVCQEQRLASLEAAVNALQGSPSPAPPGTATPDPTTPSPDPTTPEPTTPAPEPASFYGWDGKTLPPPRLSGGGSVAETGDARLPWHTNTGLYDPARRAAVLAKPTTALKVQSGTPGSPKVYSDLHASSVDYTGAHDFVVQFSVIEGNVQGTTGADCAGCYFIHDDIGNARGGGQHLNTKGSADFYRNNIFGFLDGVSPWNSSGEVVVQDNFIHDMEWQPDSGQSSGFSHNDDVQPKVNAGTTTLRWNTLFTWMWNGSTQKGTVTRSSGPNWYKTPTAAASATGGHNQTSGVLSGDVCCPSRRLNLIGNLFRGAAERYIQHRGNGGDLVDNRFSSTESAAGPAVVGSESRKHFTRVSGNTYWAGDQRAGQAVTG